MKTTLRRNPMRRRKGTRDTDYTYTKLYSSSYIYNSDKLIAIISIKCSSAWQ